MKISPFICFVKKTFGQKNHRLTVLLHILISTQEYLSQQKEAVGKKLEQKLIDETLKAP